MSLFDDMLGSEQTLFTDESVLDFDYVPPAVTNREDEIKNIVSGIKPLFAEKRPANIFITGKPGIGKTLSVRFVFNELKNTSEEIIPCYINNWKCSTYHSVFVELSKFFGVPYPRKGVSTDEIIRGITKKIDNKKGIVIAFDEIDKARSLDFIYPLIEGFGRKIGLLFISNYSDFLKKVDSRLLSRLNVENLDFKPYSRDDVSKILMQRVNHAFYPEVFTDEAFSKVVDYSFKHNDLRLGISLLLKSGRIAENDSSRKVFGKHVDEAVSSIKNVLFKEKAEKLEEHEQVILELLKTLNGAITGELYDKFLENHKGVSMRTFRKYLNRLETLEFVRTEDTGSGFRGKSRKIYLG